MPYAPPKFPQSTQAPEPPKPPTLWQTTASVLAAFFGVQSSANRERDFKAGKASQFIVIGLIATAGFVLTLWLIVRLVLRLAAA